MASRIGAHVTSPASVESTCIFLSCAWGFDAWVCDTCTCARSHKSTCIRVDTCTVQGASHLLQHASIHGWHVKRKLLLLFEQTLHDCLQTEHFFRKPPALLWRKKSIDWSGFQGLNCPRQGIYRELVLSCFPGLSRRPRPFWYSVLAGAGIYRTFAPCPARARSTAITGLNLARTILYVSKKIRHHEHAHRLTGLGHNFLCNGLRQPVWQREIIKSKVWFLPDFPHSIFVPAGKKGHTSHSPRGLLPSVPKSPATNHLWRLGSI